MKFVIVEAAWMGPFIHEFESEGVLMATLMAFRQKCGPDETATLWRRVRRQWEPMFPWQHGVRS